MSFFVIIKRSENVFKKGFNMKYLAIFAVMLSLVGCDFKPLSKVNESDLEKSGRLRYKASLHCFKLDNKEIWSYQEDSLCKMLAKVEKPICKTMVGHGMYDECNDMLYLISQPVRLNLMMQQAGMKHYSMSVFDKLVEEANG